MPAALLDKLGIEYGVAVTTEPVPVGIGLVKEMETASGMSVGPGTR